MQPFSNDKSSSGLYQSRSKFKWMVLAISAFIGAVSIFYTNVLVKKIRDREERTIELYANTLEYFANEPNNQELTFMFDEIVVANKSIPVIITDELNNPIHSRNIPAVDNASTPKDKERIMRDELKQMEGQHEPILVTLRNADGSVDDYQFIYYKNSNLLTQLQYYPVVQLSVIAIFGIIAFLVFNYSKTAEQNRVWVGMAKETAHQLGTPLSSLMAWVEYLKSDENLKDMEMITELEKDVERLNMITSRFSNIGSEPVLRSMNVYNVISGTVSYLKKRISSKVIFNISYFPNKNLEANINKPLFEWVIENLCKNAVDAMSGEGKIDIKILKANEGHVVVDISDTGKGIAKSKVSKIFQPGFSTKQRGWGLGLTLVKRIVENYHKGRIFVKSSESNIGTTFRISLKS